MGTDIETKKVADATDDELVAELAKRKRAVDAVVQEVESAAAVEPTLAEMIRAAESAGDWRKSHGLKDQLMEAVHRRAGPSGLSARRSG
jgi:phage gp29-like protein